MSTTSRKLSFSAIQLSFTSRNCQQWCTRLTFRPISTKRSHRRSHSRHRRLFSVYHASNTDCDQMSNTLRLVPIEWNFISPALSNFKFEFRSGCFWRETDFDIDIETWVLNLDTLESISHAAYFCERLAVTSGIWFDFEIKMQIQTWTHSEAQTWNGTAFEIQR